MAHLIKPLNLSIDVPQPRPASSSGGGWALGVDRVENFAWSKGTFSNEELDAIINIGKSIEIEKATTYGGNDPKIRNSYVNFIFPNEVTYWVFEKLTNTINAINSQFFGFDLFSMEQGLQFTRYEAPGEHYDWHIDRGMQSGIRKLSLSLQLTDPKEYRGGDLEMWFGGKPIKASKERGMITFFPSYAMHRVKPVTKGTRYSLVAWVSGPPFK